MNSLSPARCHRALDRSAQIGRPACATGRGVERPHAAGPVADHDGAAGDERRRLGRADLPSPPELPGQGVEGGHLAVPEARVALAAPDERLEDEVAPECGRGPAAAGRAIVPGHPAGGGSERDEPPVERRQVHAAVPDDRRELEQRPPVEGPRPPKRRPQAERRGTVARVVIAVRRPGDARAVGGGRWGGVGVY